MYELYVSFLVFLLFFLSLSPLDDLGAADVDLLADFLAVLLAPAGALEAVVEAGALDAVDAGWKSVSGACYAPTDFVAYYTHFGCHFRYEKETLLSKITDQQK